MESCGVCAGTGYFKSNTMEYEGVCPYCKEHLPEDK